MSDDDSTPAAVDDQTALNRSTYDRIASRYVDNQRRQRSGNDHHFAELENGLVAGLPAGSLIADLGCGPGSDAERFAERGFRVVGMDLSIAMLKIADAALQGKVAQADLRRLPISSGRIDAIWCAAALLHVPEEDTRHVLGEFRRVVRASGTLALITAGGKSSFFETVPYAPEERRWFIYREPDRVSEQLLQAGFRILRSNNVQGNRNWLTFLAEAI